MEANFEFTQGSVKKATVGIASADLWKVPFDRLTIHPGFNVRVKDAAYEQRVKDIADSIEANGYMQDKPMAGIVVLDDQGQDSIVVTDGHTRYDAVALARSRGVEIDLIPVVTKPRGTSMEDITIALVTSNSGQRLTPYETALVCKRLIGYGMPESDIARRLGFTKTYVSDLLGLLASPKAIRDMVKDGKVSATEAIKTIKSHGKNATNVLADAAATTAPGKRVTAKAISKAEDSVPAIVKRAVKWVSEGGEDRANDSVFALIASLGGVAEQMVRDLVAKSGKNQ